MHLTTHLLLYFQLPNPNGELHLIAFHSWPFSAPNSIMMSWQRATCDFWSFQMLLHYLEGSALPIDMVTDHWNLPITFQWPNPHMSASMMVEYLSAFNLLFVSILENSHQTDALTRRWDIYLKRGIATMPVLIPELSPSIHSEQLALSLQATTLSITALHGSLIMDVRSIPTSGLNSERIPHQKEHLTNSQTLLDPWPRWSTFHLGCIHVPNSDNLQLCVLQYSMIIPLRSFSVRLKTLHQVRIHYYWPGLPVYIKTMQVMCHLFLRQTCVL